MSYFSTLKRALLEPASPLPPSSVFSIYCGYAYMAGGALFLLWPGAVQAVFQESAFIGREEGLIRAIGMVLAVIGWFYIFGGRSGASQFVAATVVDRITIVPLVLIGLVLTGVFPRVFLGVAILDPLLGIITWHLLHKERAQAV
ncbi:hypothetical protein GYB62_02745 [bacterium]|nr:hypothetical protein [bacterium]